MIRVLYKFFCSKFESSPFCSIWLEISINWHTKSQGPKKKWKYPPTLLVIRIVLLHTQRFALSFNSPTVYCIYFLGSWNQLRLRFKITNFQKNFFQKSNKNYKFQPWKAKPRVFIWSCWHYLYSERKEYIWNNQNLLTLLMLSNKQKVKFLTSVENTSGVYVSMRKKSATTIPWASCWKKSWKLEF